MQQHIHRPIPILTLGLLTLLSTQAPAEQATDRQMIERGRYLVHIAGCNDCHTPGYPMKDGKVPVSLWLTGDQLGWQGPWGTTYASNLRLYMQKMTEDQWVQDARTLRRRPPMPWFNLNAMAEKDLRAIYRFVKSLGDPGQPAPAYVPVGQQPQGPVVTFPPPPPQRQAHK